MDALAMEVDGPAAATDLMVADALAVGTVVYAPAAVSVADGLAAGSAVDTLVADSAADMPAASAVAAMQVGAAATVAADTGNTE